MAGSNKRPRRCLEEGGEDREPPREMKRWRPILLEVMGAEFLQRLLEMLEPILRRVVREEIERIVGNSGPSNRRLPVVVQNSRARFRLQFQNDLPEKLYTCSKIKSKEDTLVKIAIFDTRQECLVTSVPWSSAKIEVVVLDADFCADGQENWSKEAFRKHIVHARKGKRPLLLGEVVIKLDQGVGHLTNITFTDNSAWTRNGKFRLGLRLHQDDEDSDLGEGISQCFRVKDRRVKGNEKHHPPMLTDEIYYLEGIRKDGPIHKRLVGGGISTVQQLLRAISADPEKLHSFLVEANKKGVAQGRWETIVKNASECPPGDERYCYNVIEQGAVLIFNSIYQLLGVYFGNSFYTTGDLNDNQQVYVQSLKRQAFQNLDNIQIFNPAAVGNIPNSLQQTFASSDRETSSFTRQHKHSLDGWTSQAFPNQTQHNNVVPYAQSWFQEKHPLDGWNSRAFPNQTQCNNEVLYDQSLFQDPFARSSIHCSQEFTYCQEASTSRSHIDPAIGQMNNQSDEDIDKIILEYRRELVHRWIKLVARLKFVIHISKYLAIRRSEMWHFNIERFK